MTAANKINEPDDNENEDLVMFDDDALTDNDMEGMLVLV